MNVSKALLLLSSPPPAVFQHDLTDNVRCFFIYSCARHVHRSCESVPQITASSPSILSLCHQGGQQNSTDTGNISPLGKTFVKFQHIIFVKVFKNRADEKTSLYSVKRSFIQRRRRRHRSFARLRWSNQTRSPSEPVQSVRMPILQWHAGQVSGLLERMPHEGFADPPVLVFGSTLEGRT